MGKTILTYEVISDLLLRTKENIIFIDILNGFDAELLATVFKKHCLAANVKFENNSELDRVKVLQITNNKDFHSLMSKLNTAIRQVPNTCLVVIDTLTFFYYDSYGFNFFGRGITRKEFTKHYIKLFNQVAIETGVTVLFTLPEHLIRENNSHEMAKKALKEEKIIYEHIKRKIVHKFFSVSHKNSPISSSISPNHKSDSEIPNVKPDMHDEMLDENEIEAGISIFLSKDSHNQFKLKIFKIDDEEEDENEYNFSITGNGFEFSQSK